MKKVVAMMLSLALALGLRAGCGQKDAGTAGGTKTIESLKIAFSPYADADQITTATEPLEALLKAKLLEKGYDVREFSLMAFGGAGPLHACEVSQELGIRSVLIPQAPARCVALAF